MMDLQPARFVDRDARRSAERLLSNSRRARYRWRDSVGRCERCRDGVVGFVKIGTRWTPRLDSFGRPMQSGRIHVTPRVCTAHAYLIEVQ